MPLNSKIAMPDWLPNISRTLSLVVALVYLGITSYFALLEGKLMANLLIMGGALLFPLACIWFADEMGEFYGALPGPVINRKTPGWMVELGGWILLLLPAILFLFIRRV